MHSDQWDGRRKTPAPWLPQFPYYMRRMNPWLSHCFLASAYMQLNAILKDKIYYWTLIHRKFIQFEKNSN